MDLTTKRSWILLTLCTKYCLCYQLQLKDIQWKFSLYLLTPGPKSMNVFLTSPPHCWYALLCLVQNTEPHIQVLQVHNMRTRCTSRTNGLVTWRTIAPTVILQQDVTPLTIIITPRQGQLRVLNHIKRELNTECAHGFQINSNECINTKRLTKFQLWPYETLKPTQFLLDSYLYFLWRWNTLEMIK